MKLPILCLPYPYIGHADAPVSPWMPRNCWMSQRLIPSSLAFPTTTVGFGGKVVVTRDGNPMSTEHPVWTPDPRHVETTLMHRFAVQAGKRHGRTFDDYESLWRWSIEDRESFWSLVWEFCGMRGSRGARVLLDGDRMPGARWFPDARLNLAENLLDRGPTPDSPAVIFWGEDKVRREISHRQLRASVASMAAALRARGVTAGDRIAAFMPNMPEALVAMLAAASIGAVFTSTSPDFGVQGVIDRFGQTQPRVLFAVDGYWYNGKGIDCMSKLREIVARLPSVEAVVLTRYLNIDTPAGDIPGCLS